MFESMKEKITPTVKLAGVASAIIILCMVFSYFYMM